MNDDACMSLCMCERERVYYDNKCVFLCVFLCLFFYVRRPHCKLDLYICTILLMIMCTFLSNCVTFVK